MGLPAGQGLGSAAFAPYVQSMYTTCNFMKCTDACTNIDLAALETEELYTGYYADVTGYSYATAPCSGACNTQNMTEVATNLALNGPASICVNAGAWNLVGTISNQCYLTTPTLSLLLYSTPAVC